MKINLKDLLEIQIEVDNLVMEKIEKELNVDNLILAFQVELFEYFNAIGTWKWWKHNHQVDRERVLDELADCFAFYLAILNKTEEISFQRGMGSIIDEYEEEIQENLDELSKQQMKSVEDPIELINNWILIISASHETEHKIHTTQRFAIAIFLATQLFEGITWEEIANAYKKKSKINIERQRGDY